MLAMNAYFLSILKNFRVSNHHREPPLESESELEDELEEEEDESELLLLSELLPELEVDRDLMRRLFDDPDLSFWSFFRFFIFSISFPASSFSVPNFARVFSFSSRIRAANPVGFLLNSSGTSTVVFNLSRILGFSNCCVRDGRETYGRVFLHS